MFLLRVVFSGIVLMCGAAWSKNADITCPKALSSADLQTLKNDKCLTVTQVVFNLDGGSEKKVQTHPAGEDAPFAYTRTESNKLACWYKTNEGYICLRQR